MQKENPSLPGFEDYWTEEDIYGERDAEGEAYLAEKLRGWVFEKTNMSMWDTIHFLKYAQCLNPPSSLLFSPFRPLFEAFHLGSSFSLLAAYWIDNTKRKKSHQAYITKWFQNTNPYLLSMDKTFQVFMHLTMAKNGVHPKSVDEDLNPITGYIWSSYKVSAKGKTVVFYFLQLLEEGRPMSKYPLFASLPQKEAVAVWRDWLWEKMDALHIKTLTNCGEVSCWAVPAKWREGDYVGEHSADELFEEWDISRSIGKQQTFMFLGPPGTGKTTIAHRMAKKTDGRVLRLNPAEIEESSSGLAEKFDLLVKLISPNVTLMEDIHELPRVFQRKLLHLLENFRAEPDLLFIATANELDSVIDALRRPGRSDCVVLFDYPNQEKTMEIIDFYCEKFDVTILDEEMRGWLWKYLQKEREETDALYCKVTPSHLERLVALYKVLEEKGKSQKIDKEDIRIRVLRELLGFFLLLGIYKPGTPESEKLKNGIGKLILERKKVLGFELEKRT